MTLFVAAGIVGIFAIFAFVLYLFAYKRMKWSKKNFRTGKAVVMEYRHVRFSKEKAPFVRVLKSGNEKAFRLFTGKQKFAYKVGSTVNVKYAPRVVRGNPTLEVYPKNFKVFDPRICTALAVITILLFLAAVILVCVGLWIL